MTPYKWPYKWRIGYISLFIGGKTPCRTGFGAHHSKFSGALVVFFSIRISETLVGKQPERFPSSGKPHFFVQRNKRLGPKQKFGGMTNAKLSSEFHRLVTLAKHFWRFDRWWFNWRRVRIWRHTVRSYAQGGLALTGGRWASSDQNPKSIVNLLVYFIRVKLTTAL